MKGIPVNTDKNSLGTFLDSLRAKYNNLIVEEPKTSQKPIIKTLPIHIEKSDSVELF